MRTGFTLLEMTAVILIIGILATFAAPRLSEIHSDAEAAAVLSNVKTIQNAARLFHLKNKRLPADANRGKFPRDFQGLLSHSIFEQPLSGGGLYDWNGEGGRYPAGLTVVYPRRTSAQSELLYQNLEETADDGSSNTGWITVSGDRIYFAFD